MKMNVFILILHNNIFIILFQSYHIADDGVSSFIPSKSSPSSPLSIPNNNTTFPQFRFKNNGNKKLKTNGVVTSKYYVCCQHKCPVKYQINTMYDGTLVTKYANKHNHNPPANSKTRKDVKECAEAAMSAGATPGNVHKQIVNSATMPLSPADVPSLSQLKNWKHAMSVKDMPSSMFRVFFLLLLLLLLLLLFVDCLFISFR